MCGATGRKMLQGEFPSIKENTHYAPEHLMNIINDIFTGIHDDAIAIAIAHNLANELVINLITLTSLTGLIGLPDSLAGALYGMLLNFVPLSNIELLMSEQILIMTIIGGTGSLFGSLLGAGAISLAWC